MFDLSGRTAVVTGSSRGLGRLMSLALSKAGARVVCTARTTLASRKTVEEIVRLGREAKGYKLELRDKNSIDSFCTQVLRDWGVIDILVNNAGCNVKKPFLETSWEDFNTVLETNLRGGFFVT